MKDEFKLPNMVLCRDDIEDEELRNKLTDEDMQEIANKLSKSLISMQWGESLYCILEDLK